MQMNFANEMDLAPPPRLDPASKPTGLLTRMRVRVADRPDTARLRHDIERRLAHQTGQFDSLSSSSPGSSGLVPRSRLGELGVSPKRDARADEPKGFA
jgi:hypothetical protein